MDNITVKVIQVDQTNNMVVLKYVSNQSQLPIDEYDALAFQITRPDIKTLDDFIDSIKSQIAYNVYVRDLAESTLIDVDMSSWTDQIVEFNLEGIVTPQLDTQTTNGLTNPEVLL